MGREGSSDPIAVVEAAYRVQLEPEVWLRSLVERLTPSFDRGFGVIGYTFRVDACGVQRTSKVLCSRPSEDAAYTDLFDRMNRGTPPEVGRALHGLSRSVRSLSESAALLDRTIDDIDAWRCLHEIGARDFVAIQAMSPDGVGVVLGAPQPHEVRVSAASERRWSRVAVHVLAGQRLRNAVHPEAARVDERGNVEGDCGPRAMTALADAARRVDAARGPLRSDPDVALTAWRGLVAGTWSLVEHFDENGRRYLVARRNDPNVPDPRALSARERQVVGYLTHGHSGKYIAYALGVAESTVSRAIRQASRKLGAGSREELVRMLKQLGGPPLEAS